MLLRWDTGLLQAVLLIIQEAGEMGEENEGQKEDAITISWEEYQRLANLFVHKVRKEEEIAETEGEEGGVTKAKLIDWYLGTVAEDFDDDSSFHVSGYHSLNSR